MGRAVAGRGGVRLMGFHNPPVPWSEVERVLSGRPRPLVVDPLAFDGGDGAAWSRKRPEYQAPEVVPPEDAVPYAELHCHSNFSFLDGASHPEELAEEAARELKVPTVFGAELSLELPGPQNGEPDPVGRHLLVLADQPDGYARLSRVLSLAHLAGGEKGRPVYQLEEVAAELSDHVLVLTGCRKGTVPAALLSGGIEAAARELDRLTALFGADRVAVELTDHAHPGDDERNDALALLAAEAGLPTVATNNVHYAVPERRPLATALAAVRARRSLDEIDGWLPAAGTAYLRSGAEMAARFAAYPGAVARAAEYGRQLAFDLNLVAPRLPDYPVPETGLSEMDWLRRLTMDGARRRYGTPEGNPGAYQQLAHELDLIEKLQLPDRKST